MEGMRNTDKTRPPQANVPFLVHTYFEISMTSNKHFLFHTLLLSNQANEDPTSNEESPVDWKL